MPTDGIQEIAHALGVTEADVAGVPSYYADLLREQGRLFTNFHFPDSQVNRLLSSSADASSKCPEYKVSVVRVERVRSDSVPAAGSTDAAQVHARLITGKVGLEVALVYWFVYLRE